MPHHLQLKSFVYFNTILYLLQRIETFDWISTVNNHQTLTHVFLHFFQPVLPVRILHQKQLCEIVMNEQLTFVW